MILGYHLLSKNDRYLVFLAFCVVTFFFWTLFPSVNEVAPVLVPLDALDMLHNNEIIEPANKSFSSILWLTSGQDLDSALYFQRYSKTVRHFYYHLQRRIPKNIDGSLEALRESTWQPFSLRAIEPLLSVCEFRADDFYNRNYGEFPYPVWWDSLLLGSDDKSREPPESLECPNPFSLISIGRVSEDYHVFPAHLVPRVSRMDMLWVTSSVTRSSMVRAGVTSEILVLPMVTDTSHWNASSKGRHDTFRFLMNYVTLRPLRGTTPVNLLISAYLEEFCAQDKVELIAISHDLDRVDSWIKDWRLNMPLNVLREKPEKDLPALSFIDNAAAPDVIIQIYEKSHLMLHYDEIYSFQAEAMSMRVPVMTNTPADYMNDQNAFIVASARNNEDIELQDAIQAEKNNELKKKQDAHVRGRTNSGGEESQERPVSAEKSHHATKYAPERASDATVIDEEQVYLKRNFQRAMRNAYENAEDVKRRGERAREDLIAAMKQTQPMIENAVQKLVQLKTKSAQSET